MNGWAMLDARGAAVLRASSMDSDSLAPATRRGPRTDRSSGSERHTDGADPAAGSDSGGNRRNGLRRSSIAAIARGVYLPPSPYEVGFLSLAHDADTLATAAWALVPQPARRTRREHQPQHVAVRRRHRLDGLHRGARVVVADLRLEPGASSRGVEGPDGAQIGRVTRMLVLEGAMLVGMLVAGGVALLVAIRQEQRRRRDLRSFFMAFTHDLKTSLTSLRLQAEALREDVPRGGGESEPAAHVAGLGAPAIAVGECPRLVTTDGAVLIEAIEIPIAGRLPARGFSRAARSISPVAAASAPIARARERLAESPAERGRARPRHARLARPAPLARRVSRSS